MIHVIQAGLIVESGTHAELIALGGLYADLAAQQIAASRILDDEAVIDDDEAGERERLGPRADRAPSSAGAGAGAVAGLAVGFAAANVAGLSDDEATADLDTGTIRVEPQ